MSDPRRPELELIARIQGAKLAVIQLGSLSESPFTQKYPNKVWRHGQNEVSSSDVFDVSVLSGTAPIRIEESVTDNHHSPMKPSQYISVRLVPMLDYYQNRVPKKYRELKITTISMTTATSSIAVLSYLNGRAGTADLSAIAGAVGGVSAALTAWQEYSGADRKINRYTAAIVAIQNHLLWWNSLTPVDQNSLVTNPSVTFHLMKYAR